MYSLIRYNKTYERIQKTSKIQYKKSNKGTRNFTNPFLIAKQIPPSPNFPCRGTAAAKTWSDWRTPWVAPGGGSQSGVRSQGPGSSSQGQGSRSQGPGSRSQGPGVRGQGPGVRGQESVRSQEPGSRSQEPGARIQDPREAKLGF